KYWDIIPGLLLKTLIKAWITRRNTQNLPAFFQRLLSFLMPLILSSFLHYSNTHNRSFLRFMRSTFQVWIFTNILKYLKSPGNGPFIKSGCRALNPLKMLIRPFPAQPMQIPYSDGNLFVSLSNGRATFPL